MAEEATVVIRIDKKMHAEVKRVAALYGISMGEMIRRAMDLYTERHRFGRQNYADPTQPAEEA